MQRALVASIALALGAVSLHAQEPPARPGSGVWANYDFAPGSRILFADDFSNERVGNFPRRLELGSGSMELVEWQGMRLVRANSYGFFVLNLREVLPERFTLEVDIIPRSQNNSIQFVGPERADDPGSLEGWADENQKSRIVIGESAGLRTGGRDNTTVLAEELAGELLHLRVQADGHYVKVYVNEVRVANVPNADLGRSNRIFFVLNASAEQPALIGNIRVAASDVDMYEALSASGRIAVQGIYFDTGSDRLRPESSGTLRLIADMLAAHADLRLTIEGHTDNVGTAVANRALSERRAAAVLQTLVSQYGVSAPRLSSAGFGDTRPAAPNTTPEGRQQNRRVELVRM